MSRANKLTRRLELVDRCRSPAPLSYDLTPRNRRQRRGLAKALRAAERKKQGRRE